MSQTILVTGASSGIGKELALLFARGGDDIVLVARSEDKLQALAEKNSRRPQRCCHCHSL